MGRQGRHPEDHEDRRTLHQAIVPASAICPGTPDPGRLGQAARACGSEAASYCIFDYRSSLLLSGQRGPSDPISEGFGVDVVSNASCVDAFENEERRIGIVDAGIRREDPHPEVWADDHEGARLHHPSLVDRDNSPEVFTTRSGLKAVAVPSETEKVSCRFDRLVRARGHARASHGCLPRGVTYRRDVVSLRPRARLVQRGVAR